MRKSCFVLGPALCGLLVSLSRGGDDPKAKTDIDPAMAKLAQMIGGTWTNENPKFLVEFKYDWAFNKKAIKGTGVIGKGTPQAMDVEAFMGWDSIKKRVYYLDVHGGTFVLYGSIKLDNDDVVFEFDTLVGKPMKWRSLAKFTDRDTYAFKIYGLENGEWKPHVEQTLRRK